MITLSWFKYLFSDGSLGEPNFKLPGVTKKEVNMKNEEIVMSVKQIKYMVDAWVRVEHLGGYPSLFPDLIQKNVNTLLNGIQPQPMFKIGDVVIFKLSRALFYVFATSDDCMIKTAVCVPSTKYKYKDKDKDKVKWEAQDLYELYNPENIK